MVECAFGVLVAKWRIFKRPIEMTPEAASTAIMAACLLHNYAIDDVLQETPNEQVSSVLRQGPATTARNHSAAAGHLRESLTTYFVGDGAVQWQYDMI